MIWFMTPKKGSDASSQPRNSVMPFWLRTSVAGTNMAMGLPLLDMVTFAAVSHSAQ